MNVSDVFNDNFGEQSGIDSDMNIVIVKNGVYIGLDKECNVVLVLVSLEPNKNQFILRTKKLNMEFNVKTSIHAPGINLEMVVHIIRCYQESQKELNIFLDLCEIFFNVEQSFTEEYLMDTFSALTSFFTQKQELSDMQLQGIYAELFTIWTYKDFFDFGGCWQSKDKMKFDFSINSKTFQLIQKQKLRSSQH